MRVRVNRSVLVGSVVAIVTLLASATFALAKEGGLVTLAAPIPRDAEPGSTLTVEFTVSMLGDEDLTPAGGWPIVLRLTAPDGAFTEALGAERGASGTYTATIEVPAGGIATADFAVQGVSVYADGSTERSDLPLGVDGTLFTGMRNGAPAARAPGVLPPGAPPLAAQPVAAPPPAANPAPDYGPAILGVAIATTVVAVAAVAFFSGRRRSVPSV